jgi:hypothetical protein
MNQNSKATSLWGVIVITALIGAIIFSLLAAVPYIDQKNWLAGFASDGDVESYTQQVNRVTRIVAITLLLLLISILVYFLAFRKQSKSRIALLLAWSKEFFRLRWHEVKDLIRAVIPNKLELAPVITLIVIIVLGTFFRYAYLWRPMGHDETYTFMAFASRGLRAVITDYHLPNNHVFHTILVNLFTQLFGDSPAVIRLTSFIAGILIIPATYLVSKIFYSWKISLVAASVVASLPVMIDYSTTARGYTIISLFALLIIALAALVKDQRNLIGWCLLILFSALGMYTNPTMIYPVGMAFTWLLLSALIKDVIPDYGRNFYLYLFVSLIGVVILTGILYLPIILTSGIQSVIGNDVVETLSWSDFTQSVIPRIVNTWKEWNRTLPSTLSLVAIIGLVASFFVPKLPKKRRVPLFLAGFLWIATALLLQRVAPWPRIWLFLLPFFIIWISAGIIGLFSLMIHRLPKSEYIMVVLISILVISPLVAGLIRSYPQYSEKLHSQGELERVADFLEDYLQPEDVVVVTSPDTVVLKYYLRRNNLSKEYTELVKEKEFSRAIVVVNQGLGQTLEYVLERRSFLDDIQLDSAQEIYQSKRFILYQLSGN